MKKTILMVGALLAAISLPSMALCESRYFFSGDGNISLVGAKNGASFKGMYRNPDGSYDQAALKKINTAFSARHGNPTSEISIRFIEYLDFIQDSFNPTSRITIISGYRSPEYNTGLRNKGRLAAKASLHQYGMAADIKIEGVPAEKLWYFIREQNFGGAGYYHGASIHVDSGPSRFWDETTSGVGTDISDDNKLIEIVADKDIYKAGERAVIRITRTTLFPIGISPEFQLEKLSKENEWKTKKKISATFPSASQEKCVLLKNIAEMTGITVAIPSDLDAGRYRIAGEFCGEMPESMPKTKTSGEFEIR